MFSVPKDASSQKVVTGKSSESTHTQHVQPITCCQDTLTQHGTSNWCDFRWFSSLGAPLLEPARQFSPFCRSFFLLFLLFSLGAVDSALCQSFTLRSDRTVGRCPEACPVAGCHGCRCGSVGHTPKRSLTMSGSLFCAFSISNNGSSGDMTHSRPPQVWSNSKNSWRDGEVIEAASTAPPVSACGPVEWRWVPMQ